VVKRIKKEGLLFSFWHFSSSQRERY